MSVAREMTPQELEITMKQLQGLREELMTHAHRGAINQGFADRHARFFAVVCSLLGAAQLYALSGNGGGGMYEIFKSLCAVMATSDAATVVRNSVIDLGDEAPRSKLFMPD